MRTSCGSTASTNGSIRAIRRRRRSLSPCSTDVVKRYDIDGVHIDDYFYPYQEKDKDGQNHSVSR